MLLIPLDARHASKNVVFGRTEAGHPAAGSLFVDSTDMVKDYLNIQGICVSEKASMWDTSETQQDTPSVNSDPSEN